MRKRSVKAMGIGIASACALAAMTGCSSGPSTSEQLLDAKADAATLGYQIATWFVDNDEAPEVTLEDGVYEVGGGQGILDPFEAVLEGAVLTTDVNTAIDWCVTVSNSDGSVAASYSALRSLEEGSTC